MVKHFDEDPALIDAVAGSIEKSENDRLLEELRWTCFLREVRHFAPQAVLVNHVHDEFRLSGVNHDDPHFQRHLRAFLAGVGSGCEEPVCVVGEVHAR